MPAAYTPPPQPEPSPTPPDAAESAKTTDAQEGSGVSVLRWDTPENARHSVRVLCDAAGLSLQPVVPVTFSNGETRMYRPKDIICACIMQESGFYNYLPNGQPTTHINRREDGSIGSTDWGICQINDRYHIGPHLDFPSVDYVLKHPEAAVEFMINMYKAGKLDLWSSYKYGAYKKWL